MRPPHFHIDGQIYYITTTIFARQPLLCRPSFVMPIIDSLNIYRYQYAFKLLGYAIMPDHLHLLVWPPSQSRLEDIMRDFKTFTAKRLIRQAEVENRTDWLTTFRQAGQETGRSENKVWQDSYWDKNIYTEKLLRQKLHYIRRNPVRAGLVANPEGYPYSSYRNYVLGEEWLIEIDRGWA